jgi:peptide/nickel transport system substrate-binding protein
MRELSRAALLAGATLVAIVTPSGPGAAEEPVTPERGTLRVAVAARPGPHSTLTPLVYCGGFQTKTACYEPLVRLGDAGELLPGLASSWTVSDDGRVYTLDLRTDVTFHDGEPLDAATVRDHLIRWRGNPGNRWLGSTERMESIDATAGGRVRITLSEPWNLLRECTAINPGHVVGAGAYDHEGTFRTTTGSGPYRLTEQAPNRRYVFEAHDAWWRGRPGLERVEMSVLPTAHRESDEVLRPVLAGEVDLVADGEGPLVPRERLAGLEADPRYTVWSGPGSGVTYLRLNTRRGPFADVELRRICASAVDREELIERGELGWAEPSTTLFRAGYGDWPTHGRPAAPTAGTPTTPVDVTLLLREAPSDRVRRHAELLTEQLLRVSLRVRLLVPASRAEYDRRVKADDFDVLLRSTHGTPYDPWISSHILLYDRGTRTDRTASRSTALWPDAELQRHLHDAFSAANDDARRAALTRVQARLDDGVPIVPLFISRRVAVSVAGVEGLVFGQNGYDLGLGTVGRTSR